MHDLKRVELKLADQYNIRFAGLREGSHKFSFVCDKRFFDNYPVLEARDGIVNVSVTLEKGSNMLSLQIEMDGYLEIQCDRCLDYFKLPLRYSGNLVVKFSEDKNGGTEELWVMDPGEYQLEMKHHFFECIGLCLPIQRMHPTDKQGNPACNDDMLELLQQHHHSKKDENEGDPRWNKLKDLLNNNN